MDSNRAPTKSAIAAGASGGRASEIFCDGEPCEAETKYPRE